MKDLTKTFLGFASLLAVIALTIAATISYLSPDSSSEQVKVSQTEVTQSATLALPIEQSLSKGVAEDVRHEIALAQDAPQAFSKEFFAELHLIKEEPVSRHLSGSDCFEQRIISARETSLFLLSLGGACVLLAGLCELSCFCVRKWLKRKVAAASEVPAIDDADLSSLEWACSSFNSCVKYHTSTDPNCVEDVLAATPTKMSEIPYLLKEFVERRHLSISHASTILEHVQHIGIYDGELFAHKSQQKITDFINSPKLQTKV